MAGDTSNARLWANADVYVNFDLSASMPTDVTTEWGTGWDLVGLLDPEEGFTETREQETTDHFAWGGLLVRKARSQHQRMLAFVALEDNDIVFQLVNPSSPTPTEDTTGLKTRNIMVPRPQKINLGMELREGDSIKRRFTDTSTAELSAVDERTESETELAVYTITTVLYPDAEGNLYTELIGSSSGGS